MKDSKTKRWYRCKKINPETKQRCFKDRENGHLLHQYKKVIWLDKPKLRN